MINMQRSCAYSVVVKPTTTSSMTTTLSTRCHMHAREPGLPSLCTNTKDESEKTRRRGFDANRPHSSHIGSSSLSSVRECRMTCAACKLYSDGLYLVHLIGLQMNINIYKIVVYIKCHCDVNGRVFFKSSARRYDSRARTHRLLSHSFPGVVADARANLISLPEEHPVRADQLWRMCLKFRIGLAMRNTIENVSVHTPFEQKRIGKRKSRATLLTTILAEFCHSTRRIVIMCSMRCSILSRRFRSEGKTETREVRPRIQWQCCHCAATVANAKCRK